jgi:S-methylmethionine-dependent homocysteine/selenocysteine methylase
MAQSFRTALPQLDGSLWLTDGGIETTLIFQEGLELPDFAAFHLLKTAEGEAALRKYFRTYADLARRFGTGLILESATWRASPDWAGKLGHDARDLNALNRKAVSILEDIRKEYAPTPAAISGCLGPRGDGYNPARRMTEKEAEAYHGTQVGVFADSAADLVSAITMNYVEEAIGIARAARKAGMPAVISFTVETDGRLPTGQSLQEAIEQVDAATLNHPSYYMINCAHPTHFERLFLKGGSWIKRIKGLRANASRMSHAELNESPVLDAGDPAELGGQYAALKRRLPQLNVMGGCCGTDHRHVEHMALACKPLWGQSN